MRGDGYARLLSKRLRTKLLNSLLYHSACTLGNDYHLSTNNEGELVSGESRWLETETKRTDSGF